MTLPALLSHYRSATEAASRAPVWEQRRKLALRRKAFARLERAMESIEGSIVFDLPPDEVVNLAALRVEMFQEPRDRHV